MNDHDDECQPGLSNATFRLERHLSHFSEAKRRVEVRRLLRLERRRQKEIRRHRKFLKWHSEQELRRQLDAVDPIEVAYARFRALGIDCASSTQDGHGASW